MTDSAADRPRQVTFAGWMIVIGSAVVVFSAFERMSGLHSLETQESVRDFLSTPPGDGIGLSVDQAIGVVRALALIAGGTATASAILGVYALRRSSTARLVLAILAVPTLLAGMAVGGLVSALVVAASVMLWVPPAREWFRGVSPQSAGSRSGGRAAPYQHSRPDQDPRPGHTETGGGTARAAGAGPATASSTATRTYPAAPARTPGAVVAACVVTWVSTALVAMLLGLTAVVLAAAPDMVFEEVQRQDPTLLDQGIDREDLRIASLVIAAVVVPWCIAAAGFAVLVIRRVRWARTALLVSAAVTATVSLVAMFGSAVTVVTFVAAVVVFALLSRADTKAWFDAARPPR